MRRKNGLIDLLAKVKVSITGNQEKCEQAVRISRTLKLIQPRDEAVCFHYDARTAFMIPRLREDFTHGNKVHIIVDFHESISCKKMHKNYYVVCGEGCDPKEADHAERTARALALKDKRKKIAEPAVTMVTPNRVPLQLNEILTKQRKLHKMMMEHKVLGDGGASAQTEKAEETDQEWTSGKESGVGGRMAGRACSKSVPGPRQPRTRQSRPPNEEMCPRRVRCLMPRVRNSSGDSDEDNWVPMTVHENKKKKTCISYPGAEALARLRYMITPKQKRLRPTMDERVSSSVSSDTSAAAPPPPPSLSPSPPPSPRNTTSGTTTCERRTSVERGVEDSTRRCYGHQNDEYSPTTANTLPDKVACPVEATRKTMQTHERRPQLKMRPQVKTRPQEKRRTEPLTTTEKSLALTVANNKDKYNHLSNTTDDENLVENDLLTRPVPKNWAHKNAKARPSRCPKTGRRRIPPLCLDTLGNTDTILIIHTPRGKDDDPRDVNLPPPDQQHHHHHSAGSISDSYFAGREPYLMRTSNDTPPFLDLNEYARACLGPRCYFPPPMVVGSCGSR